MKSDYRTVLTYTYPEIVKAHGGIDSVLNMIDDGLKNMKANGTDFAIINATIGEPGNEIEINKALYSIVPEIITIKINKAIYNTNGYLIGISLDTGNTWSFVDNAGLEDAKKLLPDLNQLVISKRTPPVLQNKE